MKIIGYDKYLPKEIAEKSGIELVAMDELLAKSDYITIHTTLTDETYHLMSTEQFGKMKPTATIINTSRGPVIDEKALVDALRQKKLAAACLDVFEQEPPAPDNPLFFDGQRHGPSTFRVLLGRRVFKAARERRRGSGKNRFRRNAEKRCQQRTSCLSLR